MAAAMRTVLFSTLFPSSVRPRHGLFVATRAQQLVASGEVETCVVAPVPWFPLRGERYGEYGQFARTPGRERWVGFDVRHPRYVLLPRVGMSMAPFNLAMGAYRTLAEMRAGGFDFDLIDAHYYYPDGVAAALLGKWLDKPVVITARGTDINLIADYALPRRMIRWAAHQAAASIGVSRALVDKLALLGAPPDKLHVLRNGVDAERFRPLPQCDARRALGLGDRLTLVSVGNLVELKGHELVIDAMREFPDAQLVIVGEGEARGALMRHIDALDLADRVSLAGARPQEELPLYYSAADALVLASSREGWPNVLLEAMACGTPVVVTRLPGTAEVVAEPAVGELVDERSGAGFAQGVRRLLQRAPETSAIRRYAERHSWHEATRGQLELFRRVLAARGAQPVSRAMIG